MTNDLTVYKGYIVPADLQSVPRAEVMAVPGSGLPHVGGVLVIIGEEMLMLTTQKSILKIVYYEAIKDVDDTEFKGLVIPRMAYGVRTLSAPNETSGVLITYKGANAQTYNRRIKLLTFSANNARRLADTINLAIETYHDKRAMDDLGLQDDG